ncbi:MAG: entericidin [Chromatiaceae bacterium]
MSRLQRIAVSLSILSIVVLFGPVGCNTTAGLGKDIGAAGAALEKEAKENKSY